MCKFKRCKKGSLIGVQKPFLNYLIQLVAQIRKWLNTSGLDGILPIEISLHMKENESAIFLKTDLRHSFTAYLRIAINFNLKSLLQNPILMTDMFNVLHPSPIKTLK